MSSDSDTSGSDTGGPSPGDASPPERTTVPSYADRGRSFVTMKAVSNGREPPEIDDSQAHEIGKIVGNAMRDFGGMGSGGGGVGRGVGTTHDGDRDVWDTLGYPEIDTVTADDYLRRYQRQDIARAIISQPVETTWKTVPEIIVGQPDDDKSEFERHVKRLFEGELLERGFLHYAEWADRRQRIGEYGILVIGVDDGASLDRPVQQDNLSSPDDLRYLTPYSQAEVVDWELADLDSNEREPGLPITYTVKMSQPNANGPGETTEKRDIHYSRVIHLAEQPESSILKHTPPLRPILNRLIDLEKVAGASAEMFWSSADRKFFATTDGSINPDDVQMFDEQMYEMVNGMRTSAVGENMDLEVVDGQDVDPSGVIDSIIKFISAVVGIPQRKLFGSERGDLASSMDQETWYSKIQERREQFAEPLLIRRILDRLVELGLFAPPPNGDYEVRWPSLFELDAETQSDVHRNEAAAIRDIENAAAMGADREELYRRAGYDTSSDLPGGEDIQDPGAATDLPGDETPSEDSDTDGDDGDDGDGDGATAQEVAEDVADQFSADSDPAREQFAAMSDRRSSTAADYNETPSTADLLRNFTNAQYTEGSVVASPNGVRGVVMAVLTSTFDWPIGDDDTQEIDASTDSPVYVVALESGAAAPYRGSSLASTSFDADSVPSPDGEALAPQTDQDVDDPTPSGWTRQSALKWWSSIGGTMEDAMDELEDADGFDGEPEALAASLRDYLLSTRRWRNRF